MEDPISRQLDEVDLGQLVRNFTKHQLFEHSPKYFLEHISLDATGDYIEDTLNAGEVVTGTASVRIPVVSFPREFYVVLTINTGFLYRKKEGTPGVVKKVERFGETDEPSSMGNDTDTTTLVEHLTGLAGGRKATKDHIRIDVLYYTQDVRLVIEPIIKGMGFRQSGHMDFPISDSNYLQFFAYLKR